MTEAERGARVKVTGQIHRRFWTDIEGRHSRVEVVASEVEISDPVSAEVRKERVE